MYSKLWTSINRFGGLNKLSQSSFRSISSSRPFCKKRDDDDGYHEVQAPEPPDPISRTFNILKHDMKVAFKGAGPMEDISTHTDIAIIGGGVMGSAIAYFLKQNLPREGIHVTVIEKDPTYAKCSTVLSVGGVRQQFSLPENVQMSLYSAEFLRNAHKHLAVEGSAGPDMHFHPMGYLMLASEKGAEQLHKNQKMQEDLGAKVMLLSPQKLKERFPWINVDDVALATLGTQNEGWFDPWSLMYGFKRKAMAMGVEYAHAEVVGFEFKANRDMHLSGQKPYEQEINQLEKIIVRNNRGELKTIKFAFAILAAGHNSGKVAEMARIGRGEELLSVPLPVEPRKRYVYHYHSPGDDAPGLDCPLVIDHTGAYFRREGLANYFIGGQSPPVGEEPSTEDLEVDYDYFNNTVWPNLANRVPAFNNLKVKSAWAGYYDYNTFDQNAIIGPHPYYPNLYFATGFSGHGIQQAPAVGKATAEMILDGEFRTINLHRFLFERLIVGKEAKEQNII